MVSTEFANIDHTNIENQILPLNTQQQPFNLGATRNPIPSIGSTAHGPGSWLISHSG